jgi:hypothetical protein
MMCNHEILLVRNLEIEFRLCGKRWFQNYSDQEGVLREEKVK